jgi:quinolinate synthase
VKTLAFAERRIKDLRSFCSRTAKVGLIFPSVRPTTHASYNGGVSVIEAQPPLPPEYADMPAAEARRRILDRKAQLARTVCLLGHHYQRDEIIDLVDFTGDSLKLSQLAAAQKEARYIVFCGVHFMAESADILSGPDQIVCLPHLAAGCRMADMADARGVQAALDELAEMTDARVLPIAYVNSSAAIKAVTGRAGGACCTSSNVRNVCAWALADPAAGGAGAGKVLCVPDQHLGRNTAFAMGYGEDDCVVYDPALPDGGLTAEAVARAKFILWKGHCYVHQLFRPEHIRAERRKHPDTRVIVHPECPRQVVALADASGSTEQIIRAVAEASPGSRWAVGTESHLVRRLAKRHPDRTIRVLGGGTASCVMMQRIDLPHLLWVMDNLADGRVVNQVSVPPAVAADARAALQRMIDIKAVPDATPRP